MKKNCFLYVVFFGTIIIGSAIYLFENHFSDLFFEEGKKIIVGEIEKEWKKDFSYVQNSSEKDSLRILVKEFVLLFEDLDDIMLESDKINNLAEDVSSSFEDSIITQDEIKLLSDLFLKVKNEKLKSN
ncbi:MAG: hypothetical protein KJN64_05095 [Ignavibacteria bacterium]|nr:hypothetical protein [Ignavibacteria bacterium]MBT8383474.1 hypothetical protein [Ignavibacteria bacterium]MBT8392604.1 hypothetical protein [Ignavibacteria bacterium]NNJ51637.1 hypothetical protein [Ignavibacteriaceae bacterium]NNL20311.1 hypothetical protein [Ignavibacteriaceae bacterium]